MKGIFIHNSWTSAAVHLKKKLWNFRGFFPGLFVRNPGLGLPHLMESEAFTHEVQRARYWSFRAGEH